MPDIDSPVVLTSAQKALVKSKLADPAFTHLNWSDDDLEPLRKHIRDHYRTVQRLECAYCKKAVSSKSVMNCHVEHLVAKSLHRPFMFEPKNLCVTCADCNTAKRNKAVMTTDVNTLTKAKAVRYPHSSGAFKLIHPHYDVYDDNIIVILKKVYLPYTDKGYFTAWMCDLNSDLRVLGWRNEFVDIPEAQEGARRFADAKTLAEARIALRELQESLLVLL